eukprot:3228119-Amphidinium_carterae.1
MLMRNTTVLAGLIGLYLWPCVVEDVTSIYTIYSEGGPWQQIINHFTRSLHMSSPDVKVHLIRYNGSSPHRLHKAGVLNASDSDWKEGLSLLKLQQQAVRMGQDRMNSWRASMLVKVQMIRSLVTRNQGKIVVVSDADHTFFPGWKRTVLECLRTKVHTLMDLNMPCHDGT